jgi:pimeloyl-ACP methyl ester carboxylesterase
MAEAQVADSVVVEGITIRYRTYGEGQPVVVFVHGIDVGGSLWDGVASRLDGMRRIVPTGAG